MQIDEQIEEHVREAYRGVAAEDGARIARAFEGLSPDDAATTLGYGLFVMGFVINDVLRKGATDADLDGIAQRAIETVSGWVDLGDKAAVVALLSAASKGDGSVPGVPPEDVLGNTFVLGGYLLQAYRLDSQHWWEYLDDIWAQAQATQAPGQ
jgi:hypothetical protein